MKAIIETHNQQIMIDDDSIIYVDGLYDVEPGTEVVFDKVLYCENEYGKPYLTKAIVKGMVESHSKTKKTLVYKYKPKKNYSRKFGHRQNYTRVKITEINNPQ